MLLGGRSTISDFYISKHNMLTFDDNHVNMHPYTAFAEWDNITACHWHSLFGPILINASLDLGN